MKKNILFIIFIMCLFSNAYSQVQPFSKKNKWGIVEGKDKILVQAKYDEIMQKGNFYYVRDNKKWGIFNNSGKEITKCKYSSIGDFVDGLALIENDNGYGLINELGKEIVECKYSQINPFYKGLAMVRNDATGYGFIDKTGKEVVKCQYSIIEKFDDQDLALVKINGKCGYINAAGKEIIPCKYSVINKYKNRLYFVKEFSKWFIFDISGNKKENCIFDEIKTSKREPVLFVKVDKKYKLLEDEGCTEITKNRYDQIDEFSEGLASAKRDGKFGFLNLNGDEIIPFKYDMAYPFTGQKAMVKYNGGWATIDNKGNELTYYKD